MSSTTVPFTPRVPSRTSMMVGTSSSQHGAGAGNEANAGARGGEFSRAELASIATTLASARKVPRRQVLRELEREMELSLGADDDEEDDEDEDEHQVGGGGQAGGNRGGRPPAASTSTALLTGGPAAVSQQQQQQSTQPVTSSTSATRRPASALEMRQEERRRERERERERERVAMAANGGRQQRGGGDRGVGAAAPAAARPRSAAAAAAGDAAGGYVNVVDDDDEAHAAGGSRTAAAAAATARREERRRERGGDRARTGGGGDHHHQEHDHQQPGGSTSSNKQPPTGGKAEMAPSPPAASSSSSTSSSLLAGVPVKVQEAWVCEDLGYVLQGVEGELIKYASSPSSLEETSQRLKGVSWQIDRGLDMSLLIVLRRLLPMATYYTAVRTFVELRNATEHGMVNHALASGIRDILKDYHHLTARLESLYLSSPDFTLQAAYLYLHPTLHTLAILHSLCLSLDFEEDPADDSEAHSSGEDDSEDEEDAALAKELGLDRLGAGGLKDPDASDPKGPILGGEVLGLLAIRAAQMSGDPTASALHADLLRHAAQPYARILIRWIEEGVLQDPYKEFMVRENRHITKGGLETDYTDEYWERRYTLRDGSTTSTGDHFRVNPAAAEAPFRPGTQRLAGGSCVPPFLEPWKHKVLMAGKYLNVIKECGLEVKGPEARVVEAEGQVKMNEPRFYQRIENAYIYANETLLKLMLNDQNLLSHLRSVKHFFFLDQSEFLDQFLDNAASELRKPIRSASMTKIQSLLYMAVSNPASASSLDPHKEDLRVVFQDTNLFDWLIEIVTSSANESERQEQERRREESKKKELLTIDALSFDFEVKFPLSLVLSRKTITRYQLIFRFLLSLRHLELQLTSMWTEHKTKAWRQRLASPDMERWKRRVFCLRAQMLQWVQHVLVFATGDVLETNWKKLEDKLGRVGTVDQLLREHVDYLDSCLKECMLTNARLLNVTSKLINAINTFSLYQPHLNRMLSKYLADPQGESERSKVEARWAIVEKFESHFRHHVATHFDVVSYQATSDTPALHALVSRLFELRKANEDR